MRKTTLICSFLKKSHSKLFLFFWLLQTGGNTLVGQTNPVPQIIPYNQVFSISHTVTAYPAGWQGWSLGSGSSTGFRTTDAVANLALKGGELASTTTGGVLNYNGKIGILATSPTTGVDPSLCLAIQTTGRSGIRVDYDVMTIRNPFNGSSNNRINELSLQYRVGASGSFTTLTGIAYQNNTTQQTATVTTPQNTVSRSIVLPSACDNQPVVQLRWVQRDVSGSGERPSFAIDNIAITLASGAALNPSSTALSGLNYIQGRGPSASRSILLTASNLTSGGGIINVAGSSNFEVSTTDSISGYGATATLSYTGTGTLATNRVWVRLKAGLLAGVYAGESITLSGGGALATITATGSVAPPNDLCPDAISVQIGSTEGTTIASTLSGNFTGSSTDVWYRFVPTCSTTYSINTTAVDQDLDIFVYNSNNCAVLNAPVSSGGGSSTSKTTAAATFPAIAGNNYLIRIASFGPTRGAFTFRVVNPFVAQAVTTAPASLVYGRATTLNGNIATLGVCPATIERGFVYAVSSLNNNPIIGGANVTKVAVSGIASGAYNTIVSVLQPNTGYSYKAYLFDGANYTYGATQTFTTTAAANWDFGITAPGTAVAVYNPYTKIALGNISAGNTLIASTGSSFVFLTNSVPSSGYSGISARYNAGNVARTGALNTGANGSAYFEFSITPEIKHTFTLMGISFGSYATSSGPRNYSLRSSLDNYASEIAGDTLLSNSLWSLKSKKGLNVLSASGSPVTFRIYGYGGTGTPTAGTINWRVDDVTVELSSLSPGAISTAGQTICSGAFASEIGNDISATGDGLFAYSWRSSADNYTNAIQGATTATYTPPAGLTTTTSFRRYVSDGNTPVQSEGTWTVTVNSAPTIGNITSPDALCAGSILNIPIPTVTDNGSVVTQEGWEIETVAGSGLFTGLTLPYTVSFEDNGKQIRYTATNGCGTTNTNQNNPLSLNIKNTSSSTTDVAVCFSNLPYSWNGDTYSVSGTYRDTLVNSVGCDSIAILNLTVIAPIANPAVPSIRTTNLITNVCGGRKVRYSVTLPAITSGNVQAEWSFVGSVLGAIATIDSGGVNSSTIVVLFTSNLAAAANDSVRVRFNYNNGCTFGPVARTRISLGSFNPPSTAVTSISQQLVSNNCGARIYRYTAFGSVHGTGFAWTLPATLGGIPSGATIDSGDLASSKVIRVRYASNSAAINGDSIRVRAYNLCSSAETRAFRLTNTAWVQLALPVITTTNVVTNVCGGRKVRYSIPAPATGSGLVVPEWSFVGSVLGTNAVIDSGNANSRTIVVLFSSNLAAAANDSVRVRYNYNSGCTFSARVRTKINLVSFNPPSTAVTSISQQLVSNTCSARIYRYTAFGAVHGTGFAWTLPATLGGIPSGATIDSGDLASSKVIRVRYTSDNAAINGDSIRVRAYNLCSSAETRAFRLTNTALQGCIPPQIPARRANPELITFGAKVYPNPSRGAFNVQLTGSGSEEVELRITDIQGRSIKQLRSAPQGIITLGSELKSGVYLLEVRQGNNRQTARILKQ
ncbi:MAG: T9SS type A sorting domain-containing protein [Bacteroidetes bacterium]|nr:T9SS type A sorting domain-containing protein [Bacteroidota bacterium]